MNSKNMPVMLYDGDCGFCQYWVEKWRKNTYGRIRYEAYQRALENYPKITEEECREAVQLVMPDGKVSSGAAAVFGAFKASGRRNLFVWFYEHVILFDKLSEFLYKFIARNRALLSKVFRVSKCRI